MAMSTLAMLALLTAPQAPHPAIQPKVQEINDHRLITLVKEDDGFNFNQPGLKVTFDLDLRAGYQFAAFDHDNANVQATDSRGTDLTKVENSFSQSPFETMGTWTEEGMVYESLKLNLGTTRRDATSFSVRASVPAIIYAGLGEHEVSVSTKASELSSSQFGQNATIELHPKQGMASVTIRPGTLKESIEKIELLAPNGEPLESGSAMWNDHSVQYTFSGEFGDSVRARLTYRKNVQTVPIQIELKDQPLP